MTVRKVGKHVAYAGYKYIPNRKRFCVLQNDSYMKYLPLCWAFKTGWFSIHI